MDNEGKIDPSHEQKPQRPDDEFKSLVCSWLRHRLDQEKNQDAHTLDDEKLSSQKQKRYLGWGVAIIAITTPLVILWLLLSQIMNYYSGFHKMGDIPQAILISVSFLSFIVIYTMLIKGLFEQKKEKETLLSIEEIGNIWHKFHQNTPPD